MHDSELLFLGADNCLELLNRSSSIPNDFGL